jgi:hypothetical protein
MEGDNNCLIKIKVYLGDKDTFNIYQNRGYNEFCVTAIS